MQQEKNKPVEWAGKMQKIISLCKRRGFIYPGSEIYGGLANSWDFGPLGCQLKKNIKDLWWQYFVVGCDDIIGVDAALMMNPRVWEASGHLAGFADPLIDCKECKARFRIDDIIKPQLSYYKNIKQDIIMIINKAIDVDKDSQKFIGKYKINKNHRKKVNDFLWYSRQQLDIRNEYPDDNDINSFLIDIFGIPCTDCGAEKWSKARDFNLMFKTFIGPAEDSVSTVYLRPETAQGMFVNFKNILDSTRVNLPFGIAQIGKAFRNEITPGNFIFRVLEFEQMEIEYFIREQDWERFFGEWQGAMSEWLHHISINRQNWLIREHQKDELSHYSKKTVDFEYRFPFGQKELYGLAYRTDFDLKNHQKHSAVNLEYTDPKTGEKFIPHVIEPTFGVERTVLAVLCDAYCEVEGGRGQDSLRRANVRRQEPDCRQAGQEIILRLDKKLAPVKVAVFPLIKKEKLIEHARAIVKKLRQDLGHLPNFVIAYDESGSIGKRYRRQDEIGTPYCITVDFESLKDQAVTVRDRDTMKQERVGVGEVGEFLSLKFKV